MRKYSLNKDFFKKVDTEQKAYILGLIMTDGNVSNQMVDKHYRLRITLKASDIDILEKVKNCLEYTGEIKVRELKSNQRDTKGYMVAELSISNKTLITDLNNLGVMSNKTQQLEYPKIPRKLHRHFIRGCFDGDGTLYARKDRPNGFRIEFVSASENFFNEIIKNIEEGTKVDIKTKRDRNNVYEFGLYKMKALPVLQWIYDDSSIYLDRKFELYKRLTAPLVSDN